MSKQKIEVGKKYLIRDYPNLGLADLQRVKIVGLFKTGDGKEIVSYKYNFPFTITKQAYKEEFLKNLATEAQL